MVTMADLGQISRTLSPGLKSRSGGRHLGGDPRVAGLDAEAGDRALIADHLDLAVGMALPLADFRARREDADLLGPEARPFRRSAMAGGEGGGQHVRRADEVGDEARPRPLIDIGGHADLDDLAVVEHGDAIGHRQSFALVVRDEDEGDAELLLQRLQLLLHLLPELEVERAERLVEEQNLRAVHQRAGERHALALAAGKLRRAAPLIAAELDHGERGLRLGLALFLRQRP